MQLLIFETKCNIMNKRTRLYNFLIDSMVFFIIVSLSSILLKNYVEREDLKYIMILMYYFYYFIFELTIGQTIGKMITKTKVVDIEDNKSPSFSRIFIRTLSRLIPIDFLSYLFKSNGIHDILSKTKLKNI
ncbi:RDD family protein [Pontimicrobium aquaticum]|uniref:RDD family protein n=2 Tax=Pontimicrobium aquaticum TaxID=2565367 RepID=A0A4U0EZ71_9FLAO|nr:RDD family protein [Pontimicrobium aquaticum]